MYRNLLLTVVFFYLCIGRLSAQNNDLSLKNSQPVFPQADSLNYLSFEFADDHLYVLADLKRSHKKNYFLVMNEKGEQVASTSFPGNYTELIRPWGNRIFAGTKDTVWQVFVQHDSILLAHPVVTPYLKLLMKDVLCQADGVIFKRTPEFMGLRTLVHAHYKDELGKDVSVFLHQTTDTVRVEMIKTQFRYRSRKKNVYLSTGPGITTPEYERSITGSRSRNRTITWMRLAMYYYDEKFYFLDCTNGNLVQMDRSLSHRKIIDLPGTNLNTDSKQALIDMGKGDVYFMEKIRGQVTLRKYDRETGALIFARKLGDIFKQAMNMRIHNGKLYYILNKEPGSAKYQFLCIDLPGRG